jgi:adenylate cyclase
MSFDKINKRYNLTQWNVKQQKLFWFIIAWVCLGILITGYDHLIFHSVFSGGTSAHYSFFYSLLLNVGVGFTAALLGGSFLVFYVNEKFRQSPYWKSIALISITFIVVSVSIVLMVAFILSLGQSGEAREKLFWTYLMDAGNLKNMLIWFVALLVTQITLMVNDKFGQGVLWDLIRGKYHSPREETRIFMFVDLISSTAIAEKLTNQKYHLLLRDFYSDITSAILHNKGEIYQYVGDEIVISWKLTKEGFNDWPLHCYFDMRKIIADRSEIYMTRYGLVPDFKAGLHYGKVIAGEIGIIKRDITFSGDVLNTTSRIQSKCNEYSVKILTSDELLHLLPYSENFNSVSIGDISLKGKENKISLSTLELKNS